jgi:MFS family permease
MEQIRSSAPEDVDATRVRLVFGALLLGFLLAALDQTVVATARPTILRELGGLYQLSWVVTAYALTATVSTPVWGKLGDLYGRKRVFQAVIALFLAGSALCGLSPSLAALIAFRGLQGLGAGGLLVTAQAIVADIFDPRDRARYQGFIGAVFANLLAGKLAVLSGVAPGISGARALSDLGALSRLPPDVQAGVLHAVATSLDGVYLLAAPVAAVALVLALFLPEVPLRLREEMPGHEAGAQRLSVAT